MNSVRMNSWAFCGEWKEDAGQYGISQIFFLTERHSDESSIIEAQEESFVSGKGRHHAKDSNPVLSVIYIAAVMVCLVFILYCIFQYRKQGSAYQERVQQMISEEDDYSMTEWIYETETEAETP